MEQIYSQPYQDGKCYFASTMSKAVKNIQDELGLEALILSAKTIPEGVLVQAAAPEPLASKEQTPVSQKNATENFKQQNIEPSQHLLSTLIKNDLPENYDEIIDHEGAVALVGPTGAGKTTTIAKLAAQFIRKYSKDEIAIISSDFYRLSAREQLRLYGKILDISVSMVGNIEDLEESLLQLSNKRLILIDSAGVNFRDIRLTQKLNLITHTKIPLKIYCVISSASVSAMTCQVIDNFGIKKLSGTIITKLDEYPHIDHTLSTFIEKNLPISYLSTGQNVPDDLSIATLEKLKKYTKTTEHNQREPAYG